MKLYSITITTFLITLSSVWSKAQPLDSLGCTGAVGDAKFSVLSIDDFQSVNGDCWILMDGSNVSSSKLGAFGFSNVPDGRGVFIRANDTQQTGRRDVDRAFGDPIGTFQNDAFQGHSHKNSNDAFVTSKNQNVAFFGGTSEGFSGYTEMFNAGSANDFASNFGSPRLSKETRPKNITLYLYIRIN